jgi:pimeloyl-ACP methyl ester carboxylesterase
VIYLAGGPGQSGIESIRIASQRAVLDSLRSVADVILLDQRGTGRSSPSTQCPAAPQPTDLFKDDATYRNALRAGLTACATALRRKGVLAAHYTTPASAHDVESLRQALGVEQVSLLGFSYGTHLGLAVLRAYGPRVQRAILAGVEGPDHNEKRPLTMDFNLQRLASLVRADSSIGKLAPDLVAAFDSALARLRATPARLRIPNPATPGDTVAIEVGGFGWQYIVMRDLGDSNDWPVLPGLIVRTAQGNYGLLTLFARKRFGGLPPLMWAAMDCASGASDSRQREAAREAATSRFGNVMNLLDDATCQAIGAVDLGEGYRSRFASEVPTLFISGTLDSQTPPYQAEELRWGFSRGIHLVVENAGHESTLDVPDVMAAMTRFLRGERVADRFIERPLPVFRGPGR